MEKNNYTNVDKFEKWLEKEGGYPSHDFEITQPIDVSIGVGATYMDDEYGELVTSRFDKTIEFKISSWIGYSPDAEHVYGKFRIPGVELKLPEKGSKSTGGYGTPNYISGWDIDITRVLTQEEIDEDKLRKYDKKWEYNYAGDNTTRFNTDKELIKKAKQVFKEWFTGGWKLKIIND
jgi:hypothetical protein